MHLIHPQHTVTWKNLQLNFGLLYDERCRYGLWLIFWEYFPCFFLHQKVIIHNEQNLFEARDLSFWYSDGFTKKILSGMISNIMKVVLKLYYLQIKLKSTSLMFWPHCKVVTSSGSEIDWLDTPFSFPVIGTDCWLIGCPIKYLCTIYSFQFPIWIFLIFIK